MSDYQELQEWLLNSVTGKYILDIERVIFKNYVQRIFGYNSLQIGFNKINFNQGCKIENSWTIDLDLHCKLETIPFESECLDLILCPHIFDISEFKLETIEELYRILSPNGKLIITSFNSQRIFPYPKIHTLRFSHSVNQIINHCNNNNLTFFNGKFFAYRPLIKNKSILNKLGCLELIGDRWFPTMSNFFALVFTKDKLNIIRPSYTNNKRKLSPQILIPVNKCKNNQ